MRRFSLSLRGRKLAYTFLLTAILLFAGGLVAVNATAQQLADPPAPEPLPPPAVFQNRIPADQLAFLNDYAGKTATEIQKDKRFRNVMKQVIPRTEYHYGHDMPLSETVETLLNGAPLPIDIREGRYVMVASHGGPYLSGKGFVWFDMKEGIALGGVYFHPVNGEPTPTLAIYSRQLKDTDLSMGQLPIAFLEDLAQWMLVANPRWVSTRYFIPENGRKYVLVHDEDYCAGALGTPPVSPERCEELNAEAADADVDAAYFMAETHNAANATAWMLGEDQLAWIGIRDQSCGVGPVGLPCRIRLTRQRTRVLIGPRRN
ncbi:MAG: lysozyme inhibitor LprI family protein [Terracidiphilus sp.]|jgi:uncharacterized protein YecT (DUF1311 family)